MGLTNYPNQYEVNKSDEEKVNSKKPKGKFTIQEATTPNESNAAALTDIMNLYSKVKKNPKVDEEPKGGNPNGDLDVDLGNTNPKDGWGRLDESDKGSGNPTPTPVAKPKPKVKAKASGSQKKADTPVDNGGKSKEWYENLANSSYANAKEYEADMKAFRKMQTDEIAKNGYYTDSQGVKVYAKPMMDKPQKESEYE